MKVRIGMGVVSAADDAGLSGGLAELVDELEAHQVDSVWLSDQASSPVHADPLVGLAYAAGRTTKLKLGTGVLVLPGRNPALVAAQLAALAGLAPGRVLPAFGVQPATRADRTMYPVPAGKRGEVFEESIEVVRALLTSSTVTYRGKYFQLDDATVGPLPAKPLDLWLGGRGPLGMSRIGRLGDGWLGSFVSPAEAGGCRADIESAAAGAGRTIESDHYGTNVVVVPDGAGSDVVDRVLARVRAVRTDVSDPTELVCLGWDAARTRIRQFVDVGITKFVVSAGVPVQSRAQFVDRFVDELMPLQN